MRAYNNASGSAKKQYQLIQKEEIQWRLLLLLALLLGRRILHSPTALKSWTPVLSRHTSPGEETKARV